LKSLRPRKTPYPDGGGLYFARDDGSTRGLFRFATTAAERAADPKLGRERWMGLGSYPDTSIADFRQVAADCRKFRKQGIDPIKHRRTQRDAQVAAAARALMFDQCNDGYVADHEAGWSPRHKRVWVNSIRDYVSPVFGKLPVAMVDTPLVLKVLKPIWTTKHETAKNLRQRIESVLDWATAHRYREGPNPARWKGHLSQILAKSVDVHVVKNHPAAPYQQVGGLVIELRARDDRDARCLELLILTNVRVGAPRSERAQKNFTWKSVFG
jgi:hypothetical protein